MAKHNDFGTAGEATAESYLKAKGYSILALNFRFEKAEIDIVAQIENTVVFIEVKARSSNRFGFPEEAVSEKKKEKLREGAEAFLMQNEIQCPIRFDVIAITGTIEAPEIVHIEDAFF